MNRRDLLKLLPTASIVRLNWHGKEAGAGFEVDAKKVILFVNETVIPAPVSQGHVQRPSVEVVVCPVSVPECKTIDDVAKQD